MLELTSIENQGFIVLFCLLQFTQMLNLLIKCIRMLSVVIHWQDLTESQIPDAEGSLDGS